ncbi:CIA30-domain-containing protein, partial [Cenococcum geophilum]
RSWIPSDWTAGDDCVRRGKSQAGQSHFDCSPSDSNACFYGQLDIQTLGGAGFASQRTTGDDRSWDVSGYDSIQLDTGEADKKRYTFIIKDKLLQMNPGNGREQSTISYEYDFSISSKMANSNGTFIFIPWKDFKATYRGKEEKEVSALDRKKIKRFSTTMRSFFSDQEGPFPLPIRPIKAVPLPNDPEKNVLGASGIHENYVPTEQSPRTSSRQPRWLVPILGIVTGCWLFCNTGYPWLMKQSCHLRCRPRLDLLTLFQLPTTL